MGTEKCRDGELLAYKIRGKTIYHCWDIPHLIKGVRNNSLTKDLTHFILKRWDIDDTNHYENISKEELVASWDDVTELYDFNLQSSQRLLPKVSNEHINPQKLKMKVSVATQVLSATFGNLMLRCSEQNKLSCDCTGAGQVLLFLMTYLIAWMGLDWHKTMNSNLQLLKAHIILHFGNMHCACYLLWTLLTKRHERQLIELKCFWIFHLW